MSTKRKKGRLGEAGEPKQYIAGLVFIHIPFMQDTKDASTKKRILLKVISILKQGQCLNAK